MTGVRDGYDLHTKRSLTLQRDVIRHCNFSQTIQIQVPPTLEEFTKICISIGYGQ